MQANSQYPAGAGIARVHGSFPCTIHRASWSVTPFGMTTDQKPGPRRHLLTS
jgi:hypothetical protein